MPPAVTNVTTTTITASADPHYPYIKNVTTVQTIKYYHKNKAPTYGQIIDTTLTKIYNADVTKLDRHMAKLKKAKIAITLPELGNNGPPTDLLMSLQDMKLTQTEMKYYITGFSINSNPIKDYIRHSSSNKSSDLRSDTGGLSSVQHGNEEMKLS